MEYSLAPPSRLRIVSTVPHGFELRGPLPMKRTTKLILTGALMLGMTGGGLIAWGIVEESEKYDQRQALRLLEASGQNLGLAPVTHWGNWPVSFAAIGFERQDDYARFAVVHGKLFDGSKNISREEMRLRLETLIERARIDSVILYFEGDPRISEMLPFVDECRKSRIKFIFLGRYY